MLTDTLAGRPRRDGHRSAAAAGATAGATDELHHYMRRHHTPYAKRLEAGSPGGKGGADAPDATAAATSACLP